MAIVSIVIEGSAGKRTLDQVVDEEEVNQYPALPITRAATTLGGEGAEVVEGLPGRTMSRQILAIREGLVVRVLVQPVDEAFPQAGPDVERVWQSVLDSFTYLPLPEDGP